MCLSIYPIMDDEHPEEVDGAVCSDRRGRDEPQVL